jgi:predicted transcriptional regulator
MASVKTRTWKSVKADRLEPQAATRVAKRARDELLELTLKELRKDLDVTQTELAEAADMTQSELSRLESRADHRVSSLRRYVEALGGEIEITAIIGTRRIKLTDV